MAGRTSRGATMDANTLLNDNERLAGLGLDELKQLVGLVEYDPSADPFPVSGWDALVWIVGNAVQTVHFLQSAFGMELVAYSGPETGNRDHHAYGLRSGAARCVIKGAYDPASPLAHHHRAHRDGYSRPSTTWSAPSSSGRCTSGSTSTTGSWGSPTWPSSSAMTSPP